MNHNRFSEEVTTIGRALDEWYQSRANTIGPNTARDYRLAIEHQLKPFKFPAGLLSAGDFVESKNDLGVSRTVLARHLGGPARPIDVLDFQILANLPLARLDDLLINAMRQTLLDEGLSVKRVNNLMAPLRGAVDRHVRLRRLDVNPFDLIQPLKSGLAAFRATSDANGAVELDVPLPGGDIADLVAEEGEPDPFTTAEMQAIIKELDEPMANQVLFVAWTGLRTGELIALRASDLQLDRNRILVRRSLSRGILKAPKTDKQRWVNLLPPARAALENQLALLGAPDGWAFPNPFTRTRWANESKITRRWQKALKNAGVRYRRPYQLRHTFASWMLSAGENPLYVAAQMGHADWSMIIKVYGRWIPSASDQPAGARMMAAHERDWPQLPQSGRCG